MPIERREITNTPEGREEWKAWRRGDVVTASGVKMGKTAEGAVYLSPELTSVFDFYQYFINVDDRDVGRFGEYFAGTILGIGMVVPFVLTLAEFEYFWIANAMYLVFVLSALVGATVKLIAYRRGF